jgi:hypothetical protein
MCRQRQHGTKLSAAPVDRKQLHDSGL